LKTLEINVPNTVKTTSKGFKKVIVQKKKTTKTGTDGQALEMK